MSAGIEKLTPEEFGVNGDGRSGAGHAAAKGTGVGRQEAKAPWAYPPPAYPPKQARGASPTVPNEGPGGNHYNTGPQEGGSRGFTNQESPRGNPKTGGPPQAARYGH